MKLNCKAIIKNFLLRDYEPVDDGELCELFIHGNSRAMQSIQKTETKKMINGYSKSEESCRKWGKVYIALIFLSGSLLCVSFGTMLGWPSPSYPALLDPGVPIAITIDQSAMIAGMLLNGFVVATPFSGCDCIGSKFGVLLGISLVFSGWLFLVGATDVISLMISRVLVGLGSGFGIGKFKTYLKEICDSTTSLQLLKTLPLFICFGILVSFSIGPFLDFKMLAIVLSVIPGVAFLTFIIVPDTPFNLFKRKKFTTAVKVLRNIHGKQCVDDEIENIKNIIENKPENKTILQILRNKHTRKSFIILTFLMTIQQFTGSPSLIVYSQIVFTEFNCPYPEICSIIYAITFFISTGIGIKYTSLFRTKPAILFSLAGIILTSTGHIIYSYLKPENQIYSIIPFITMMLYAIFHTAGIATITSLVINDIFPTNCRSTMVCFLNMYVSQLAVIVTKIFQVLYAQFGIVVGFSLYTSVGIFGFFVVLIFLTETKGKLERNRGT